MHLWRMCFSVITYNCGAGFKERAFENIKIKLESEFALISQFIKARKFAKLSQAEVAEKIATQQPAIARLERGSLGAATFATLLKYAEAVGCNLKIKLVRKRAQASCK